MTVPSRSERPRVEQLVPAVHLHVVRPPLVEGARVLLARDGLLRHDAGNDAMSSTGAETGLVVIRALARDRAATRVVSVVPVLHVVLLGHATGARIAHVVLAQEPPDFLGGALVDEISAPHFGFVR